MLCLPSRCARSSCKSWDKGRNDWLFTWDPIHFQYLPFKRQCHTIKSESIAAFLAQSLLYRSCESWVSGVVLLVSGCNISNHVSQKHFQRPTFVVIPATNLSAGDMQVKTSCSFYTKICFQPSVFFLPFNSQDLLDGNSPTSLLFTDCVLHFWHPK